MTQLLLVIIRIVDAFHEYLAVVYAVGHSALQQGLDGGGIGPNSPQQLDLFDYNAEQLEKMKRLDAVMDRINRVNGTETIVLGSQQYTKKNGEVLRLKLYEHLKV